VFHDHSKHIEIMYHFIRDKVQRGVVRLQYISTEEQVENVLMKPLVKVKVICISVLDEYQQFISIEVDI